MIGTKLAHYEITGHLGSGGMGDVYQATDAKLGRSVAVKFLPQAFVQDAGGCVFVPGVATDLTQARRFRSVASVMHAVVDL